MNREFFVQVSIAIDEKIVAHLNRDGGVEQFELNGVMTLEVCLNWMRLDNVSLTGEYVSP